MNIAYVSATFPPYPGGTGNVCFHNAREMARRGHRVAVFTASAPPHRPAQVRQGLTIHRLPPTVRVGNAPLLLGLPKALRGFDLIHLHAPFITGAELTALGANLNQTPLVVTYHNDLIGPGGWRNTVFDWATWSLRTLVLRQTRRLIFVSQGHAETSALRDIYHTYPERCAVLPNGVDLQSFFPVSNPKEVRRSLHLPLNFPLDAPIIGFVGGLDRAHHYKGLEVLLAALTTEALANAYLLVVGDGDLAQYYSHQAEMLGINNRVLFYGSVAQEALPPLYCACDVVAVPSLVPESFGLVILEALACGVPVVASESPGVRTLIEPNTHGLLVPPGNVQALAEALHHLLTHVTHRQLMGHRGCAEVAVHYGWEQIGAQLETIYHQVLQPAGHLVYSRLWEKP